MGGPDRLRRHAHARPVPAGGLLQPARHVLGPVGPQPVPPGGHTRQPQRHPARHRLPGGARPHQFLRPAHPPGMGRPVRHQLRPRHRRNRPGAHSAHGRGGAAGGGRQLAHRQPREGVPGPAADAANRRHRGVPGPRPVPVLRLLRADADPDVRPHRDVGRRPTEVRRRQVRDLHPARQRVPAGGDHRPVHGGRAGLRAAGSGRRASQRTAHRPGRGCDPPASTR